MIFLDPLDQILEHAIYQSPILGVLSIVIYKLWKKLDDIKVQLIRLQQEVHDHIVYTTGGKSNHAPSA